MVAAEAEQVVNRFLAAWERADADELLAFFADDAVWQPGPMKAVVGKPHSVKDWRPCYRRESGPRFTTQCRTAQ